MTWETFDRLSKEERSHFHRCAGCGALVDERDEGEARQHVAHADPMPSKGLPREQQAHAPLG